jgi:hypothetical protein
MVKSSLFLTLLFSLLGTSLHAQYHFVYLTDKQGSSFSKSNPELFLSQKAIERRERQNIPITYRDLPVNSGYLDQIKAKGAKVIYSSKWLNAVLIDASESIYGKVKELNFVRTDKDLSFARKGNKNGFKVGKGLRSRAISYGNSATQNQMLGIDAMHSEGMHGEGLTIAVLDAGFYKANELAVFDSLFKNNRITSTYDFVNRETSVYEDNQHGMQVFSAIGGYLEGSLIGGAYKSNYVLLKTEDTGRESKVEEIYWLMGAEYADSVGADILTSSLGYNTFDNAADNYTLNQLDGKTAIITQAADYAAGTGMLVVVSVGNEGNDQWGKLTFPGDADSVLAVGAVNANKQYANFSSRGNTTDGRIKPDVAAMGVSTVLANPTGGITTSNGTSFSCPLIAGLAAGLWQTFPELTNMQILELLKRSGDRFFQPDSLFGYGIPNYSVAKQIQINGIDEFESREPVIYPNPVVASPVTVFDSSFHDMEIIEISIFNSSIDKVFSKQLKVEKSAVVINDAQLDNLPAGNYILKVSGKNKGVTRKLIKL